MNRRGSLALVAGLFGFGGCEHLSAFDPKSALTGGTEWYALGKKVQTPEPEKVSPASLQTAERVETLGRRIIVQNTFTGLDPLFHTVGIKDPVLFHRGTAELFISEGLANRCKTDAELAAVLCSELGRMQADRRSAQRVGRDKEPIPEVGPDGPTPVEKQPPEPLPAAESADPQKLARGL
ncbi:MAG TPA: hypothetical protein VKE74_15525, partial [Gemmataceae bacterium]|nr:hypothetical protein [Gemmataceae bacterium]